jgi:phycoerythrin-associated linker protein
MPFGPASQLGVARFDETSPVERLPGMFSDELETIIAAVYRQVLGNAYVMESERLTVPESKFKSDEISVREFVRLVAKSDLYRSRFFDSCSRYRYIELAFKHLLGRAPDGYDDMKAHSAILDDAGFEADIDSYIDSDEYQENFGEDTVPFLVGYKTQTGKKMVGFTHLFQLQRGSSSSDLKGSLGGNRARLNRYVINETPAPIVPPSGGSAGWAFQAPPLNAQTRSGVGAGSDGKIYRIEVTGYRSNVVNRVSKFRRSNKVYFVPYDKLADEYKRIAREGGIIASITPVG